MQRGRFEELLAADGPFRRLARDLEGGAVVAYPQAESSDSASGSRASSWARVTSSEPE
jgi:hypothetical protein